jgi:hypothetical protein
MSEHAPLFQEQEGSLPCPQQPVTGHYPEPVESVPYFVYFFQKLQTYMVEKSIGK